MITIFQRYRRYLAVLSTLAMLTASLATYWTAGYKQSAAQVNAQYFPETGKSITGRFLEYWQTHGGLEQQGYPISDVTTEISDTDGKIYTVQYFERSLFEAHPENSFPNDVLLSLLGVFRYKQVYPVGAQNQVPSVLPDSRLFSETGKKVGGAFLAYWINHGGLAQQGLPISDEFIETSELDGKPYRVQYFERAVFEYHPENAGTAYEVLLSQLGKFRYLEKQMPPTPTVTLTTIPTVSVPPPTTTVSNPTAIPQTDCSGIPASTDSKITPDCVAYGVEYNVEASGFTPGETVQFYVTRPNGSQSTVYQDQATSSGEIIFGGTSAITPLPGIWTWTFTGLTSGKRSQGNLKVTGPNTAGCTDGAPPEGIDASVSPVCARIGTVFTLAAIGFKPGEEVGYYWTLPDGSVYGAQFQIQASSDGYVIGPTLTHNQYAMTGVWAVSLEGVESHHKAVAFLKLYR